MIKIKAEVNEIENKKAIEETNEIKSWFFKKISKTDKLLAKEKKQRGRREKANQKYGILCDWLGVNICLSPVDPEWDKPPKHDAE